MRRRFVVILALLMPIILLAGDATRTKLNNWRNRRKGWFGKEEFVWDIIEPYQLGILASSYTADDESTPYTTPTPSTADTLTDATGATADSGITIMANPADGLSTADSLRDDLVANYILNGRKNVHDLTVQVNCLIDDQANYAGLTDLNALRTAVENLRGDYEANRRPCFGQSNKWEGVPVIRLADADEIHYLWIPQKNWNAKRPVYLAIVTNCTNNSSGITLTATYDAVNVGINSAGVAAADGATALTETLAAITDAQTTINVPYTTVFGKINGQSAQYDGIFFKIVASGATAADRANLVKMIIGYEVF